MHAALVSALFLLAADDTMRVVHGAVTDTHERPLAGVSVVIGDPRQEPSSVTKTTTDDAGLFRLSVPRMGDDPAEWNHMIVVHKPGWAVSGAWIRGATLSSEPLRIMLRRTKPVSLRLVDPQGRAVAGARITLDSFQQEDAYFYGESVLGELLSFETNHDGRVSLETLPATAAFGILVMTVSHGKQKSYFPSGQADHTFQLRRTGSLVGRITAEDPDAVGHIEVSVESRVKREPRETVAAVIGQAKVRTDAEGRFEVPQIAEGESQVTVTVNQQLPFRTAGPQSATLRADETTAITIPLHRGTLVRGSIVDAETDKPLRGIKLDVWRETGEPLQFVTSDELGAFEARVGPGQFWVRLWEIPREYLWPVQDDQSGTIEPGTASLDLPTLRLRLGGVLRGTVVDENGRPAPGVWVTAKWLQHERYLTERECGAQTGEDGEFVLQPVDKDAEIALRCDSAERASLEETRLPAGHNQPVHLKVSPDGVAPVAAQIVDDRGRPVAGAQIRIRGTPRAVGNRGAFSRSASSTPELKSEWNLVSDEEGRFATRHPLPKLAEYRITIEAPGTVPHRASFHPGSTDPEQALGEIVLKRVLRIAGRVVNREGRPLPGASVFTHGQQQYGQMASATSGADGRFTLEGAHPDAVLLFARKDGFRFTGARIPRGADSVTLTLTRRDDPPDEPLTTRRLAEERRRELLKQLLLPVYERQQDQAGDYFRREILEMLVPIDRQFVLDRLIDLKTASARSELLLALGERDDALAQAGGVENAYSRTYALFKAADTTAHPAERQKILGDALLHARGEPNPAQRVVLFGNIAERLIDAGDTDSAETVLADALEPASQLPTTDWAGFARGHFAETLALVDLDEALSLVEELQEDSARDRHNGNIAHELAGSNPAEAERVLGLVKPGYERDRYATRVCYRMAPVDLERARRLAADIQRSQFRACTWGVMAMSVAQKDTATGRELLRQAFDEAEKSAAHAREQMFETAVVLVRFAETLDPEATTEYLWRAAALHPGPQLGFFEDDGRQLERDAHTAKLILLLALYHVQPDLTAALAEPIFKRVERREPRAAYQAAPVYAALALVDPERAIAWHARFFKNVEAEQLRLISPPQAWRVIAGMLAPEAGETWEFLQKEIFRIWVIDTEDF